MASTTLDLVRSLLIVAKDIMQKPHKTYRKRCICVPKSLYDGGQWPRCYLLEEELLHLWEVMGKMEAKDRKQLEKDLGVTMEKLDKCKALEGYTVALPPPSKTFQRVHVRERFLRTLFGEGPSSSSRGDPYVEESYRIYWTHFPLKNLHINNGRRKLDDYDPEPVTEQESGLFGRCPSNENDQIPKRAGWHLVVPNSPIEKMLMQLRNLPELHKRDEQTSEVTNVGGILTNQYLENSHILNNNNANNKRPGQLLNLVANKRPVPPQTFQPDEQAAGVPNNFNVNVAHQQEQAAEQHEEEQEDEDDEEELQVPVQVVEPPHYPLEELVSAPDKP